MRKLCTKPVRIVDKTPRVRAAEFHPHERTFAPQLSPPLRAVQAAAAKRFSGLSRAMRLSISYY